jgi:hypothetical protein
MGSIVAQADGNGITLEERIIGCNMKKETVENEVYIGLPTDVLNFVTKSSTEAQRRKFGIGDIFINATLCLKCRTYLRSVHAHDYKTCKCGAVAVDGGSRMVRRLGNPEDRVDIIEYFYK